MPKWKPTYDSDRKYKEEWEAKFTWLKRAPNKVDAYCKICNCTIKSKFFNFSQHEVSAKHKANTVESCQSNLSSFVLKKSSKIEDNIKKAEIRLAVSVSCHCSIMSIDHMGEIIKKEGKGSTLGGIKLHRSKCSAIIKNIVSPALQADLRECLNGKKFFLLIDESTDISTKSHMYIVIRYFNEDIENPKIETAFLALVEISSATAQALFGILTSKLNEYKVDLRDCISFASDGAATMVGKNNSVWTKIKEVSPNCVQMKC